MSRWAAGTADAQCAKADAPCIGAAFGKSSTCSAGSSGRVARAKRRRTSRVQASRRLHWLSRHGKRCSWAKKRGGPRHLHVAGCRGVHCARTQLQSPEAIFAWAIGQFRHSSDEALGQSERRAGTFSRDDPEGSTAKRKDKAQAGSRRVVDEKDAGWRPFGGAQEARCSRNLGMAARAHACSRAQRRDAHRVARARRWLLSHED
mmetsp:Transcript_48003/g.148123  ORF Transcript_48003/g.148123 Transcript_48003/m.148123 type:complete len:204 (+) Transcript_48003:144-755(+)